MADPTNLIDLQALAHKLYIHCNPRGLCGHRSSLTCQEGQEPSCLYRPVAKSARALRNKLEEIDEALREATIRPEVTVLHALDQSRNVLLNLDRALRDRQSLMRRNDDAAETWNATELLADVDDVIKQLMQSLEALEQVTGSVDVIFDAGRGRFSPTASFAYSGPGRGASASSTSPSAMYSSNTLPSLRSSTTDVTKLALGTASITTSPPASPHVYTQSKRRPPLTTKMDWSIPFSSLDPMSIDIESASSIILGSKRSTQSIFDQTDAVATPHHATSGVANDDRVPCDHHATSTTAPTSGDSAVSYDPGSESRAEMLPLPSIHQQRRTAIRADVEIGSGATGANTSESASQETRGQHISEETCVPADTASDVPQVAILPIPHITHQPRLRSAGTAARSRYRLVNPDSSIEQATYSCMEVLPGLKPRPSLPETSCGVRSNDHDNLPYDSLDSVDLQLNNAWSLQDGKSGGKSLISDWEPLSRRTDRRLSTVDCDPEVLAPSDTVHSTLSLSSNLEVDMDKNRCNQAIEAWNNNRWHDAEKYIGNILDDSLCHNYAVARRCNHLLGVLASLKSEWHQALTFFLSAINTPISNAMQLDMGDCAAAYWLGDTYAHLNRHAEALLAYSIAEHGTLFQSPDAYYLHQRIRAEQSTCQLVGSRSQFNLQLDQVMLRKDDIAEHSIFDTNIITHRAAKSFLDSLAWPPEEHALSHNQSRAVAICQMDAAQSWALIHKLHISETAFENAEAWPLTYDPWFNVPNAVAGQLISKRCDLLQNIIKKSIPKARTFSRKGMDSFTCYDLRWLILTLRDVLSTLGMLWNEFSSACVGFSVWYESSDRNIATRNSFTISLFRPSLRPGYGAEVCPDGIYSSRVRASGPGFDKGVHAREVKRIRQLIRGHLDAALVRQDIIERGGTVVPVASINGTTPLQRRGTHRNRAKVSSPISGSLSISSKPNSMLA